MNTDNSNISDETRCDKYIKYWLIEAEISDEEKQVLMDIAQKQNMTIDEIFSAFIKQTIKDPDEFKDFVSKHKDDPDFHHTIHTYPVHEGETEEQAKGILD